MSRAGTSPSLVPELTLVRPDVTTGAEALRLLAEAAVDRGYAAPSFVEAVASREATYPTGLPLPMPVAIPHADAEHVLRPGLAALVPPRPLRFGEMGSRDRYVDVELVLMLLVDDPEEQVELLSTLVKGLQRTDLREALVTGVEDGDTLVKRFSCLF